ncbi:hypothetical protein BHM03_00049737, partial [Ensete ventricosum]
MGALATLTKWIPEDDFLLKNAVEVILEVVCSCYQVCLFGYRTCFDIAVTKAGASLESLAKGAVCFSRRFTLRELQERWYSLLYDSETSAEASARMIEFEIEVSMSNPSKGNRNCNLKGKYSVTGKRKGDSLRSHYHARRKRIRSDPCNSGNPGFLLSHYPHVASDSIYGGGDRLNLQDQQQAAHICPGERILSCYGYPETGYDNEHIFPEMVKFGSATASGNNCHHAFHTEYVGSVEDECPDGIVDREYLYDFKENISLELVDKERLNAAEQALENDYIQKSPPQFLRDVQKDSSQFLEENLPSLDASEDINENKPIQPLPINDSCGDKVIEVKPISSPASENENYDGVQKANNTSLHVPKCGDIVHQLGCSSTTIYPLSGTADISSQ